MGEKQIDIEQLLKEGKCIQIEPQGFSMYPMFVPGRDAAVIAPVDTGSLRRGDVILYRRKDSILVLHRIWKVRPEGMYLVGDNQTQIEGPLPKEYARGILVEFVRKGRRITVTHPLYRLCGGIWLLLRPFRHKIAVLIHRLKQSR